MRRRSLLLASLAVPGLARAQAPYPDRPVRIIVPFPPGGATDLWARIAADGMQPEFGQPIVVENRAGAGGLIGTEAVAKSVPDGYTLLFTITTHVTTPVVMKRFPYDPVEDFAPIGRLGTSNSPFVIGPKVPAEITTWPAFVAWAKGRDLTLGTFAPGSTGHAFTLMLAQEAGLKVEVAIYRGEAPYMQDILSSNIHGGFLSMATGGENVRGGRLRPLAAGGDARIPSLPQVPLLREIGLSDRFAFSGFSALFAPARTPQPALDRLAEVFRIAAHKPETRRRLIALDTNPAYQTPAELREQVRRNLREWTEMAERLNLAVEG